MNRVPRPSKETAHYTVEPYAARRAVRQAAADNTQKAILSQFPGLLGGVMMHGGTQSGAVRQPRRDDYAAQAA